MDNTLSVSYLRPWARPRFQFLPVTAQIPWRFVVNWRADVASLRPLIPKPLTLDMHDGMALLSACVLRIENMGIAGFPAWLRFSTDEVLYRIAVRYGDLRSFFTLRSDVGSSAMAVLGGRFSHYLPRRATFDVQCVESLVQVTCAGAAPSFGHVRFCASLDDPTVPVSRSRFASLADAVDFVLGVSGSVSVDDRQRVCFQEIEHPPWDARFVEPRQCQFEFSDDRLQRIAGTLTYDSTILILNQRQKWQAMRYLT